MKNYIEIQSSLLMTATSHNGIGVFCPDFTGRNISGSMGSGGPENIKT